MAHGTVSALIHLRHRSQGHVRWAASCQLLTKTTWRGRSTLNIHKNGPVDKYGMLVYNWAIYTRRMDLMWIYLQSDEVINQSTTVGRGKSCTGLNTNFTPQNDNLLKTMRCYSIYNFNQGDDSRTDIWTVYVPLVHPNASLSCAIVFPSRDGTCTTFELINIAQICIMNSWV